MRNLTNSLNCDRADKECFRPEVGIAGLPCEVGENSEKRALPQTIIVLGYVPVPVSPCQLSAKRQGATISLTARQLDS